MYIYNKTHFASKYVLMNVSMKPESLHADNFMHIALISSSSQEDGEVSESLKDLINHFES